MTISRRLACVLLAAGLTVACDTGPSTPSQTPTAGTVRGVVDYHGSIRAPLLIAVFRSFPPLGQPVAAQTIEDPQFPQAFAVSGIPAGRYFVLAIIDTDTNNGYRYDRVHDPGGAYGSRDQPLAVTVDATNGAHDVNILLVDPSSP